MPASICSGLPLAKTLEIMSPDSTDGHVKSVYAHYGLTLYLAQCLEHGLVNALVYVDLIPRKARAVRTKEEWTAEFDSFMGRNFMQTLGSLIRDLRDTTTVPPELEDKLTHALRRRNYLAHHFFRERAEKFMSVRGRDSMVRELEEAQTLFQAADDLLDQAIKPIREKHGFTDNRLGKFYTDYVSKIEYDL